MRYNNKIPLMLSSYTIIHTAALFMCLSSPRHFVRIHTAHIFLAVSIFCIISILLLQRPFHYTINVGNEEYHPVYNHDTHTDVPFVSGFMTSEKYNNIDNFRWMSSYGNIQLLGIGQRSIVMSIIHLGHPPQFVPIAPSTYTISTDRGFTTTVSIPKEARVHELLFLAESHNGSLQLTQTSRATPDPDAPRLIATMIDVIQFSSVKTSSLVMPDWHILGLWIIGFTGLWWITIRYSRSLHLPNLSLFTLLTVTIVLCSALFIDIPRTQLGARPFAFIMVLGVLLQWFFMKIHRVIIGPIETAHTPYFWADLTSLIALGAACMRLFGRFYPGSMTGDVYFHANRLYELSNGLIFLISKNRGVDFPYPPMTYLFVSPLSFVLNNSPVALQFVASIADAGSVVVIYLIMCRLTTPPWASLASALYVGVAATHMTTWWSFDSHIYTQFFSLLLCQQLLRASERWNGMNQFWQYSQGVFLLMTIVCLGHYGFFINIILLLSGTCGVVVIAASLKRIWAQRIVAPLIAVYLFTLAFSITFYYSQYWSLFFTQLTTAANAGLQSIAGRTAVDPLSVWPNIFFNGVYTHVGIFPFVLAPFGLLLVKQARWRSQPLLLIFIGVSLFIATFFAIFPLITGVSNSPRWFMFILWIIICGSTLFVQHLWYRGRIAQLSVICMAAFVFCNTLWVWIAPMLWRWRPPEPF